jgi:putative membrane protein insertion efficiency factor
MSFSAHSQYTLRADGQEIETSFQLTPHNSKSAEDYIHFYQKFISGLRGGECPMFPSCSNYALQAINQQGFVKGVIHGTDRLLRCGHEHALYPLTLQANGFKLLDPADNSLLKELEYLTPTPYHSINLTETDSAKQLISFLINESMYSEALVQIYKYKLQHADSSVELYTNEFICYNALKQYEKLAYKFETLPSTSLKSDYRLIRQLLISQYKLGNYAAIKKVSMQLTQPSKEQALTAMDCKNLVFAALMRSRDLEEADKQLQHQSTDDQYRESAAKALEKMKAVPLKSPAVAGIVSAIIPGSGYAYAGSYLTGFSALVFNGLMSYAAVSSFRNGNRGMGVLTGLFGMAFYIGNIQGSAKQARRVNDANYNRVISQFEQQTHIY